MWAVCGLVPRRPRDFSPYVSDCIPQREARKHWSGGYANASALTVCGWVKQTGPLQVSLATPRNKLKPDCGGSISSELDDVRGKMR